MAKQDEMQLREIKEMLAYASRRSGAGKFRADQLTRADLRSMFAGSKRLYDVFNRWLVLLTKPQPAKAGKLWTREEMAQKLASLPAGEQLSIDEPGEPSSIETVRREWQGEIGAYAKRLTGTGSAIEVSFKADVATSYLRAFGYLLDDEERRRRVRWCPECSDHYYADDARQKFCSPKCRSAYNQSKYRAKRRREVR